MKPARRAPLHLDGQPFSILERIDVGETKRPGAKLPLSCRSFSILERIDVGETLPETSDPWVSIHPFSILERIDVGETRSARRPRHAEPASLSVSSNGSTWVKLLRFWACRIWYMPFSILERIDVGETTLPPGRKT